MLQTLDRTLDLIAETYKPTVDPRDHDHGESCGDTLYCYIVRETGDAFREATHDHDNAQCEFEELTAMLRIARDDLEQVINALEEQRCVRGDA